MDTDKISETKKEFNEALLIINNIIDSDNQEIKRFKFSPKEKSALLFVSNLISSHLEELKNY